MIYRKYDSVRDAVIYQIKCNETDEVYIGSTVDLKIRISTHITSKNKTCESRHIINRNNYTITILEEFKCIFDCTKLLKEQWYLDTIPNINKKRAFRTVNIKLQKKLYNLKNRDHQTKLAKLHIQNNKEHYTAYKHNWYEKNKERLTISGQQYRDTHKEQKAINDKKYRESNKEKIKLHKQRRMTCAICGREFTVEALARHNKTLVHLSALEVLENVEKIKSN